MLTAVCLGTNDLAKAADFYDAVLGTIGMERRVTDEVEIGFGVAGGPVSFWILKPFDKNPATFGNGTQVMFKAETIEDVHRFYDQAIASGGSDEGAPGPRDYSPTYYGAYLRDLDGNKLHVYNAS